MPVVKLNFDQCYVFESVNGKMNRTIDHNLKCYHEEADTKISYHVCQLITNYRVEVHYTDSDIPVILLANFDYRKGETNIICNMSSGIKKLYLNINEIHRSLGNRLARALPTCHIFTGNDFNPSFYRKGKKKAYNMVTREEKFQTTFIDLLKTLPSSLTSGCSTFEAIEEFV